MNLVKMFSDLNKSMEVILNFPGRGKSLTQHTK